MTMLSNHLLERVARSYREQCGIQPRAIRQDGRIVARQQAGPIDRLPAVQRARAHALGESLRWGETYIFFLAPGIISWVAPLVDEDQVFGGLLGGDVMAEDDEQDRFEAVQYLTGAGCSCRQAETYVKRLPAWEQVRTQKAADYLYAVFYQMSGWTPMLLARRRERARQQSQIAEEIHRRKTSNDDRYPLNNERMLNSMIRAGDRRGARKMMNRLLGAVFLKSANPAVLRARIFELMGYLVRRSVEESPQLEPLLERSHAWMARIIEAETFEEISDAVRNALDDFIDQVYRLENRPPHRALEKALDYIDHHYTEPIRLEELARVAGLSTYRIAHLMREHTGRSMLQHVHHRRVEQARLLLETTDRRCVEIALDLGFGDQSYFTKQFRLRTGTTPARYRRAMRRG